MKELFRSFVVKTLTAEAQKLIASYITSIFASVPFPANIILAAGAGAAAGARSLALPVCCRGEGGGGKGRRRRR